MAQKRTVSVHSTFFCLDKMLPGQFPGRLGLLPVMFQNKMKKMGLKSDFIINQHKCRLLLFKLL